LRTRERAEIGAFGNGEISGGHSHRTADGAEDSDEEGLKFFMFLSVFICVLCGWIGVGDAFDAEFGVFEIQEQGRFCGGGETSWLSFPSIFSSTFSINT